MDIAAEIRSLFDDPDLTPDLDAVRIRGEAERISSAVDFYFDHHEPQGLEPEEADRWLAWLDQREIELEGLKTRLLPGQAEEEALALEAVSDARDRLADLRAGLKPELDSLAQTPEGTAAAADSPRPSL